MPSYTFPQFTVEQSTCCPFCIFTLLSLLVPQRLQQVASKQTSSQPSVVTSPGRPRTYACVHDWNKARGIGRRRRRSGHMVAQEGILAPSTSANQGQWMSQGLNMDIGKLSFPG